MRSLRLLVAFLMVLAAAPALLWGQGSTTGTIIGQITDPTGAVIAGATVTLTDTSTNISQSVDSNGTGLYVFSDVKPGTYNLSVTKSGFRKFVLANQQLTVGATLTLNATLEVGATTQTVEVTAAPGAQLQTQNATMGSSGGGEMLLRLPSIDRDVSSVLGFQPTAAPSFNGAEGNITAGGVAGQTADQNTYTLDGGINTDDLAGDNGYVNSFSGTPRGAIPTPIESIEEFKVNTNNTAADFSTSAGAQVLLLTKRGANAFHGSAYDYFQGQMLNSNDWDNNFHGTPKPKAHYNRFGGSFGGPMLPKLLGGKTYFYVNYEGERFPRTGPFTRLVPSDLLRQGIVQFRDATGTPVQYNLKTSTQCGASGGLPCDPLGIGLNPVVSQLWSTYEPEPNDFTSGDRLNTFGFRGNLTFPIKNDFVVGRFDHDFGTKWRWMFSYRYYKQVQPTTNQVDIGGLLPGDKKGVPASASSNVLQPRYFVTGLTGTLTPTLTNEFHFNYVRNDWQWIRAGALPQISGIPGALEVGGEGTNALIPINVDTQNARKRLWDGHDWNYRDTLSWLRGSHFFQFGGEAFHQWLHFDRYDNVVGGLTQLGYEINNSGVVPKPEFEPLPCSATITTNCLPSDLLPSWRSLYAQALGIVDTASIVATRTGANLTLNPLGKPVQSYDIVDVYSLYFNDAWKIRPNLTLSYGLNWGVQLPPFDQHGVQDILVDPAGNIITAENYLANRLTAANNGQVYNPTLGYSPIGSVGRGMKYPYRPFYGGFGPRISLAWSPNFSEGWLGKLFGSKSTVFRGGYARVYDRTLPINFISATVLGDGFLQPVSCKNPSTTGQCTGPGVVDPTTAFRIGVNGNVVPLTIPQTLSVPVQPGIGNTAYAVLADALDNNFRPGVSDQIDFSIQRQLKGNTILELGYVGVWAKHLYQGLDLSDVPWMMKLNGQTFANAYDNLSLALQKGMAPTAIAAQPFLEAALGGPTSAYCSAFASCTAAVASGEKGNILTQSVTTMWTDLESSWVFGTALPSTTQCFFCYINTSDGFSNYQAFVATLQKRTSHGLTMNANFTYGHALGTVAYNQTYTLANLTNPWNFRTDYGPQYYDRKFVFNALGLYELPFGRGHHWSTSNGVLDRIIGGWSISPIFSWGSGLPLPVFDGSFQEFGQGNDGNAASAVPLVNTRNLSNSPHFGLTSNGFVGVNGDAANGGPGVNLFGNNAATVFNNDFRPILVGIDGRSAGTGQLRGQSRWNLDLGLTKQTRVTERVGVQFYAQAINVLNHMQWNDPFLSLQDPADFGVLGTNSVSGGQYGNLALGGAGASPNYTRIIQLGLRVSF